MNKQVDAWIDAHQSELIKALQGCVAIPSVSGGEPAPGAPFGTAVHEALRYVLSLCEGFGMQCRDMDGYIGYADCGAGKELLGVLTHLDVVPAGEGWKHAPFGAELDDGAIYGRGTLDNKGPAVASAFAAAAIMGCGIPFTRRVRLLFGCDEEIGMRCLTHYTENEVLPDMSFSPDSCYPLVNSEKGIFHCHFNKAYPSAITVEAGTVVNAVPGLCTATVPLALNRILPIVEAFMEESEFPCVCEATGAEETTIRVSGVCAHGSTPQEGKNAMLAMFALLSRLPLPEADAAAVAHLHEKLAFDCHGETMGLACEDASGCLTLNPGVLHWDDKGYALYIDVRYPISADVDALFAKLDAAALGVRSDPVVNPGHFVPDESELVVKLLKVYADRSGKYLPPVRSGGGTYARHLPNAVAFGPEMPGAGTRCHMADECVPVEELLFHTKMIADALLALATAE